MKRSLKNILLSYLMLIMYFSIIYCLLRWYFYIYPKFILHIELIVLLVAFVICSFFRNPSKIAYAIFLTVPLFFMSNYRCVNEIQTNIDQNVLKMVLVKGVSYPYSSIFLATPMPFVSINDNKIIYIGEFVTKPETMVKFIDRFLQGKMANGEMLFYYKEQELSKPSKSLLLSLFPRKENYAVLYKSTDKDGTKEFAFDFKSKLYFYIRDKAIYKTVIVSSFTISLLFCLLLFVLNRIVYFFSKKGLKYDYS